MATGPEQRRRADLLKFQRELIAATNKTEIQLSKIQGWKNVGYILASTLPLLVVWLIFRAIAGEETVFNTNVQISYAAAVGAGAGWANERRRTKSQRSDLKRARERLKELESTVEEYTKTLEE